MRALLIVDVQKDFLPGGALPVPQGEEIIPIINRLMTEFPCVVASKDWHPEGHCSFASSHGRSVGEEIEWQGGIQQLWPDHCVQGTEGAEFGHKLEQEVIQYVVYKGVDQNVDSYSAFFDASKKRDTGLTEYLRDEGVKDLYLVGLATNICVKATALDALEEGFRVFVVEDACRGIDLGSGDVDRAIEQMKEAGITWVSSSVIAPYPSS